MEILKSPFPLCQHMLLFLLQRSLAVATSALSAPGGADVRCEEPCARMEELRLGLHKSSHRNKCMLHHILDPAGHRISSIMRAALSFRGNPRYARYLEAGMGMRG